MALERDEEAQRKIQRSLLLAKLSENADDEVDFEFEEATHSPQKQRKSRAKPLLKPVFVADVKARDDAEPPSTTNDPKERLEALALLETLAQAEEAKAKQSFEERRIAGTAYDMESVDDTDGLDDEQEAALWRERERERLIRERREREQYDAELAEAERRRNMTEEERARQDEEKRREWEAKKAEAGEYKFLQKYYHKGAFFQDPSEAVLQRDYTAATGVDSGVHRDTLPAVMQVRNFGKKGRSKWTHLSAEDTTSFDYGWGDKKSQVNYAPINRMGGMRGDLDNPSKKYKKQ